jgi:Fe2+ transport system protein FeoA
MTLTEPRPAQEAYEVLAQDLRSALKGVLEKFGIVRGFSVNIHYDAAPLPLKHLLVFREGAVLQPDAVADVIGLSADLVQIQIEQLRLHGQNLAKEAAAATAQLREVLLAQNNP